MTVASELQRLASLIRQLQGALGGKSFDAGTANVSLTASTSGTATVSHGLGVTPTAIQLTVKSGNGANIDAHYLNEDSDSFEIHVDRSTSTTATIAVAWLAFG